MTDNFSPFSNENSIVTLLFSFISEKSKSEAVGESYYPSKGINLTMEIGIWLPKFSDVDREYERLTELGIKSFTGKPVTFTFGIRNFYVTDPEGNLLEIGSRGQEE